MVCAICGDEITESDKLAVRLLIKNMWLEEEIVPHQQLWAHSYCFARILHPSVPFDAESLADVE